HQLRGRVGRGAAKSVCLLLRSQNLSETARERLALMRETNDGFVIAEKDLELRGGGELLGLKQSGDADYRLATPEQLVRLLPVAHDDARLFVERDGGMDGPRGEAVRLCLYLFERDAAVPLLRSGRMRLPPAPTARSIGGCITNPISLYSNNPVSAPRGQIHLDARRA